jgi:hypothetical protein
VREIVPVSRNSSPNSIRTVTDKTELTKEQDSDKTETTTEIAETTEKLDGAQAGKPADSITIYDATEEVPAGGKVEAKDDGNDKEQTESTRGEVSTETFITQAYDRVVVNKEQGNIDEGIERQRLRLDQTKANDKISPTTARSKIKVH